LEERHGRILFASLSRKFDAKHEIVRGAMCAWFGRKVFGTLACFFFVSTATATSHLSLPNPRINEIGSYQNVGETMNDKDSEK